MQLIIWEKSSRWHRNVVRWKDVKDVRARKKCTGTYEDVFKALRACSIEDIDEVSTGELERHAYRHHHRVLTAPTVLISTPSSYRDCVSRIEVIGAREVIHYDDSL